MVTTEEVRDFIDLARRDRENWLCMAQKSWQEIKKRSSSGAVYKKSNKKPRYPAWYSIFKIRQSLVLARIGEPVCKDTTQDGNDNIGATAAMALERLAKNLPKNFSFFDVLCASRDDFLVTNFGWCRAYYERKEIKAEVKEYITPEKLPDGSARFVYSDGSEVMTDDVSQDDEGYFVDTEQVVDVEDERICLKHVLYSNAYIDPGITSWDDCKRIAYEVHYSPRDFKEVFGNSAYTDISAGYQKAGRDVDQKIQDIVVWEYWDKYEKECKWLAEYGSDFIKPKGYKGPEEYTEEEDLNGIYNLEGLFPSPAPLIMNAPTDEFWPVCEYYQMQEIIDDIHVLFGRMMQMTRALRPRLLYNEDIPELKPALNEASDMDCYGVSGLSSLLSEAGGIDKLVYYIQLEPIMNALNSAYTAMDQRLQTLWQRTGTSDLLQGLSQDGSGKTLGERQMEEKYANNQLSEPQRKMQEYVADCYRLIVEMALKNFKDESLDRYIMPQTLPADHQPRYRAAIGMAKQDLKRFRLELATDSTLAINEEYDKRMAIELVNALTAALEKTANVATISPALIIPELHCLKYLVQRFRQGKMFQSEITQAIDNVIKQAQSQPAPFNKEQSDFEIEKAKLAAKQQMDMNSQQLDLYKASNDVRYDQEMINLKAKNDALMYQIAILNYQLNAQKLSIEAQKTGVEIQNKLADNARLEAVAAADIQTQSQPKVPQVVVVPSAPAAPIIVAPQVPQVAGPTIINAPNPAPQTQVVQPVQQVPVPIPMI